MSFFRCFFCLIVPFKLLSPVLTNADSLHDPSVPDEIRIYTVGKDTRDYFRFLKVAEMDSAPNIHRKFRKTFDANVAFYEGGTTTFSNAKIRIAGDWKDHIDTKRNISSLLVKLKNSSIGSIVKFRLLLPRTKQGTNEVFMSILMEELGFPVPYRKMVDVSLNDVIHYEAIFEESPEKEFIERFGFRESPIVELDERQLWSNRYWMFDEEYCLQKDADNRCPRDEHFRDPMGLTHKIDNASFIKNPNSIIIGLKALNISNVYGEKTFDEVAGKYAAHTLVGHNRKFLYDPIYGDHWPIYFDGEVNVEICIAADDAWEQTPDSVKLLYDRVAWKFHNRTGLNLSEKQECAAKDTLASVKPVTGSRDVKFHQVGTGDFKEMAPLLNDVTPDIVGIDPEDKRVKRCRIEADRKVLVDCEVLLFEDQKDYVAGNGAPFMHDVYEVFPAVFGKLNAANIKFNHKKHIDLTQSVKVLKIPPETIYFVKLSDGHEDLSIVLDDPISSRLVVYQSNLSENFNLEIQSEPFSAVGTEADRYNDILLTACATILDSTFDGGEISVSGGSCEDSLNFIRVTGFIRKISVQYAANDAIDADFSRLDVREIAVETAGNDCLDLSAGYYNLAEIKLSGCKDNALSVGERSRVAVHSAQISDSHTGFAAKDSSLLYLNEVQIDKSSVVICLDAYRKKQEYRGGEILLMKDIACRKDRVDTFSKIERNSRSTCLHATEFNGVELCTQKDGITYYSELERPNGYSWHLQYYQNKTVKNMNAEVESSARPCIGNDTCTFKVKWNALPNWYRTGEVHSQFGKITGTYVDLDRLGYAE